MALLFYHLRCSLLTTAWNSGLNACARKFLIHRANISKTDPVTRFKGKKYATAKGENMCEILKKKNLVCKLV